MTTPIENAGLVHVLGQIQLEVERDDFGARKRQHLVIEELCERGILIEDDGLGTGWQLLDQDGNSLMPNRELLFEDTGYCWVYWTGLGRPHRARMYAISEPLAFEAACKSHFHPELKVIEGGGGGEETT